MYDDIGAYFHEEVLASYKEFIDGLKKGSSGGSKHLRKAVKSASALYHLREHILVPHTRTTTEIITACPDYKLLEDITNVSKHSTLTRGSPKITSASSIEESMIITTYKDDYGEYHGTEYIVTVKLDSGDLRNVEEILTNVMNYWIAEFYVMGILKKSFTFPYIKVEHPLSRQQVAEQDTH